MSGQRERSMRALFVLGQSAPREGALSAAVAMAERLSAELDTLFIEDEDLLRAASLPTGRHLVWGRLEPQAFAAEMVLRDWRALAEVARVALEREGRLRRVSTRFRVTRGAPKSELARALEEQDVVMFAAARAPFSLLSPRSARHSGRVAQGSKIHVWVDASPESERALDIAKALADASHRLEVWVPALSGDLRTELFNRVKARVGAPVPIREQLGIELTRAHALRALTTAASGALVLPESTELARAITGMMHELSPPCWVVIAR